VFSRRSDTQDLEDFGKASFDFEKYLTDPINQAAVTTVLEGFICPSDPQGSEPLTAGRTQPFQNPPGSMALWYPACMGPSNNNGCSNFCPEPADSYCCQGPGNFGLASAGLFARNKNARSFREATDGLSNTILLGESLPAQCSFNGAYHDNFPMSETVIPLNTFENNGDTDMDWFRVCGYKSLHPGGANFAMADGSVHFFQEQIDYRLYNALGSHAGDEAVSLEQ